VEEPVTLCVAAECDYEGAPCVVLCCDWRAQTGAEGSTLEALTCSRSLALAFHQKHMEVGGRRLGVKLPHHP
jgi:hypothetical protein